MARTEHYAWRIWGQNCAMVAYITDTTHAPQQWQEEYRKGDEAYDPAVAIVEKDKKDAEVDGYRQSTISEVNRIYLRTNNRTGNAWEVKLDDDANEIPAPCAAPKGDPRNFSYTLANVNVVGEYSQVGPLTQLKITTTGFLPQA